MPGLRSLVARRRSSLASPPYVSSPSPIPLSLPEIYVNDGKGEKLESEDYQTPEQVTVNGEMSQNDDNTVNIHETDNSDCVTPQQQSSSDESNQNKETSGVEKSESVETDGVTAVSDKEITQNQNCSDKECVETDGAQSISESCKEVQNQESIDPELIENSTLEVSNANETSLEDKKADVDHVADEDAEEKTRVSDEKVVNVSAEEEKQDEETTDIVIQNESAPEVGEKNEKEKDKEVNESKGTTHLDHIVSNSNPEIEIIDEKIEEFPSLEKNSLNQSSVNLKEKRSTPNDGSGKESSERLSITNSEDHTKPQTKLSVSSNQDNDTGQKSENELSASAKKNCANKCVKRSAMEIESTLASRGVTIVRRIVDNAETVGKTKNDSMQNAKKDRIINSSSVITANPQVSVSSGNFLSQSANRSMSASYSLKGLASIRMQRGSSVQHFSGGHIGRSVSKDFYRPMNSRGALVQAGPKALPVLTDSKGSTQTNFRGITIHPNSKYSSHPAFRGMAMNSNLRSPGTLTNNRGLKMDETLKGLSTHTPKGFVAHSHPRGPLLNNTLGGAAKQANLRGNAVTTDSRGLHGYLNTKESLRYTTPKGPTQRPNSVGMPPQSKSAVFSPRIRQVTPQQSRPVENQSQLHSLGPNRSKSVDVSLLSRSKEISPQLGSDMSPHAQSTTMSPQSRPAEMSPQSRTAKMSPQSQSVDVSPQFRTVDLLSQSKSNEMGLSRPVDTVVSPQSRSSDVSPQSRSAQFSPQSIHTGIHPHSRYTGMSPQSGMADLSPQSRSLGMIPHSSSADVSPQSRSGIPSQSGLPTQSVTTTSTGQSSQMNLMGVSPQSNIIGPLQESSNERLAPRTSSAALLSQANSLGISSHMISSDRFSASTTSNEFPALPASSGFIGCSSNEAFPTYNNSGEFSSHTNNNEYSPQISSGGFNMHSNSGGFSMQSNLVGFPTQTNSCGFPQHASSGEYSSRNPVGIIGQTNSEGFSTHSSCGNFPTQINSGGYTPHSSSGPYNAQTNSGEFRENSIDMMMYHASRDFSMHANNREFSGYSTPNHLPMNHSSRELLQNCNQGLPLPSNTGTPSINSVLGEQYPQSNYGDSLVHPGYREASLHSRVTPGEVPVLPDFRESSLRHSYRDPSGPPSYSNFRESSSQDNSRGSQSHSYRDMPLHSNMGELQAHTSTREQNPHASFKEQSGSAGYRGQNILGSYMESSAIPNFRETLNLGNCREQPLSNFRETVNHSSPREQVLPSYRENISHTSPREPILPSFGEPISHPSPGEQVIPNVRESLNHTSPREQILPSFGDPVSNSSPREQALPSFREPVNHASPSTEVLPCFQEPGTHSSPREQVLPSFRENVSHTSPREQILPSFQETVNSTTPKQPYIPTFRDPDTYNSFTDSINPNSSCEQTINPNSKEMLNFTTGCRQPNVSNLVCTDKPVEDNGYRESQTVPNFRVNSQHMNLDEPPIDLKYMEASLANSYTKSSALPSFTESFEHTSPNDLLRKNDNTSLGLPSFRDSSHYCTPRNVSDCDSFRESSLSPSSRSPGYTNTRNSCASWQTGELLSYPVRESAICNRSESLECLSSVYSSANLDAKNADVQVRSRDSDILSANRDGYLPEKSLIQNTDVARAYHDATNSPDYSGVIESVPHGMGESYLDSGTEISVHSGTNHSTQLCEDLPQSLRDLPMESASLSPTDLPRDFEETELSNQELTSLDAIPKEFCETAPSSPTPRHLNKSPVHSKCVTSPVDNSSLGSPSCSDSLGSPEKLSSVVSSIKSDSGASPSSQERIVIKMKLLHSDLGSENDRHNSTENASITELRLDSRNSVKYPMAKYTRWTIDSIINGREDMCSEEGSDKVCKDDEQKIVKEELHLKEDGKTSLSSSPKRINKRRSSEMCSESKDPKLDTNKNFMKKTLRITISNPLRTRVSTVDDCVDVKLKENDDSTVVKCERFPEKRNEIVQPVTVSIVRKSSRLQKESQSQTPLCSTRKLKGRHLKSPSPAPSIESFASSTSASRASCDSRRCSQSSETSASSVTSILSEGSDHSVVAEMKKCSIVIKRIYATDNYSCYSSSLCNKKVVLKNQDVHSTRPKRKAAIEATLKCHKSLKTCDTNDAKTKLPLNGAFDKGKNFVSVNVEKKTLHNNIGIPRCSVLLYDVFMNRRINKMECPGCSRHYDSTDSVQVNINKATISLLCSACQWLVVKDVHPREVDSMAPS
ncbi:hypothetical protein OTU49_016086 [Cherax quadricarinatus]|uniref:Uncharacterized protein n=1 Tax=Cherax quadricarinatus TaxID=27406 RepID=A0AAW0Y8H4_CHEQU